jgi:hypothetical protein
MNLYMGSSLYEPLYGVIIHKYMEISQGNSLCSYLYLLQAKMSCFTFYLFSFCFCKTGEQEGGTSLASGGAGLTPVGGGADGESL